MSTRRFALGCRTMVSGIGAAVVVLGLGACTTTPPALVYHDIRFANVDPMPINALQVEINSDYRPTFTPPNVEHLMPIAPERMARQWALGRLQPLRAGNALARFTILDARVTETKLSTQQGIKGAFTDEPGERYDAELRVRFTLDDPSRAYHGEVETSVRRSQTVQKDASLTEREKVWYEMVQKLGSDFDAAMTNNLRSYLPDAIVR